MVFFTSEERERTEGVVTFGSYHPWGWHKVLGGDSTNYPAFSGHVLDFKQDRPGAVERFARMLDPELCEGIAIAVVPSHDPTSTSPALRRLASVLSEGGKRYDASEALVRTTKIPKLTSGGDRSVDVHIKSVRVARPDLVRGWNVLLLDDVTTTGNSLFACQRLILAKGAVDVRCAAIAKTV